MADWLNWSFSCQTWRRRARFPSHNNIISSFAPNPYHQHDREPLIHPQGIFSWEPPPGLGAPTHQLLPPHRYWHWLSLQPRGLHAQDASKAAPPQLPNMSHITTRYTSFLIQPRSPWVKMFCGGKRPRRRVDFSSETNIMKPVIFRGLWLLQ